MAFTKSLVPFLFLFLVITTSRAQSRFSTQLRFDYIVNGINESTPEEYDQYIAINRINSRPSFAVGVQYDYSLGKKRNFAIHMSTFFEYRNYSRLIVNEYERSGWSNRSKKNFRSEYVSLPIGFSYRLGKWKLQGSLVNMINLKTKVDAHYCGYTDGGNCEYFELYSISNDFTKKKSEDFFVREEIYADDWYHQQIAFGVQYQLNDLIGISLEYRDFIKDNNLYYNRDDWDVYLHETLEQQTNSLHISVLFKL